MNQISQITNDPLQRQTLILPNGTSLIITMKFVPMQYGWFFDSIQYQDFLLYGLRICISPNMLYQYRNQIPFGLACFSKASREPSQQYDFSSQNAEIFILTESEVDAYAGLLSGQV